MGRVALRFLFHAPGEVALGSLNKYAKFSDLAFLESDTLCMFLLLSVQ